VDIEQFNKKIGLTCNSKEPEEVFSELNSIKEGRKLFEVLDESSMSRYLTILALGLKQIIKLRETVF